MTAHATGPGLIVLAAGGTGGHVFPAEALAGELARRGHRLALVTDSRSRAYGGALGTLETHVVPAATPAGRNPLGRVFALLRLGTGVLRARRVLRVLSPALVVGFGGYPSVPAVLAARLSKARSMIHEQNAVLGRANRLLAPGAAAIATSFPATRGISDHGADVVQTGNPVREEIKALADASYQPPTEVGNVRLLVTGGSQGARALGRTVPAALALLPDSLRRRLYVSQQCREEDTNEARATLAKAGVAGEVATFFEDIPTRLASAHLVVSRAGASTVAELAAAGRPALLVPYPHATDRHQDENARQFASAGGAEVMAEAEMNPDTLAARLRDLLGDSERLETMARAATRFARPEAASALADVAEQVIATGHATSPTDMAGGAA